MKSRKNFINYLLVILSLVICFPHESMSMESTKKSTKISCGYDTGVSEYVNIILVGEKDVGKSRFIQALFEKDGLVSIDGGVSSGCDVLGKDNPFHTTLTKKDGSSMPINMRVYDVMGQDPKKSMLPKYYKYGLDIAFLCIPAKTAIKPDFSGKTEYKNWIRPLKCISPKCMVVLVYTRGDEADHNIANLNILENKMGELVKTFGIRTDIFTHKDESGLLAWKTPISVNEEEMVDPAGYGGDTRQRLLNTIAAYFETYKPAVAEESDPCCLCCCHPCCCPCCCIM